LPEEPFPADELTEVEVGKHPYARFDLNDYSVPHTLVRRTLAVAASLETVRILDGTTTVAEHPRCWDRGQQIEDPAHIQPLVEHKRRAGKHRALNRLTAAAPSAERLLVLAADRGGNIGSMTRSLLVLLDQVGASELEAALAEAVQHELPRVGAVRQILDRRLGERGLPPPVSARFTTNQRASSVIVRGHSLSSYDQLRRTDDHDDQTN
jgi:hypothetical protein